MKLIYRIILSIRLRWYLFMAKFEPIGITLNDAQHRMTMKDNHKLRIGVSKLVKMLRAMSPEERLLKGNLLGHGQYTKTAFEQIEEIRILAKIQSSGRLKTETDLVKHVVKNSGIYLKEQGLSELRAKATILRKQITSNPDNKELALEFVNLTQEMRRINSEIKRMKDNQ